MSIEEFIEKLKELEKTLEEKVPDIMDLVANDGIGLLVKRIQTEGIKGAEYSEGYREFKSRKQGADAVKFVNLTYKDRMLNNLKIVSKKNSNGEYRSGMGNDIQEEEDKFEFNILRYGDDFLNYTPDEKEALDEVAQVEIQKIISKIFP